MNALKRRYLAEMGIPVWRLKANDPARPRPAEADRDARIGDAAHPVAARSAPTGQAPAAPPPAAQQPVGPRSAGQAPAAQQPAGQASTGQAIAGRLSAAPRSVGQTPAAQQPAGAQSARQAPAGPPSAGQTHAAGHALEAAPSGGLDWDQLALAVRDCTRCGLHRSRTQTVFGVGRRDADLVIVGEAPGAEEDRQGEPFVGRAGQLLNAMLKAIGFARDEVYIANILKCRPPNNRDPQPSEQATCAPYLDRQIELIEPKAILALGRIAAQWLLQTDMPIGRLRGQARDYGSAGIPLVVTYHPAYLLRSPLAKAKSWQDLCMLRDILSQAE